MKELYFRMKAWFVVRRMEKLEDATLSSSHLQNILDNDDAYIDENYNSYE